MRKVDKKAFTLIELIVTIAVLGVLVLLASPRFFGHTQKAELTKGFANARTIEKASELYYMDHEDWPRLTDDPYTSEEIKSYSERIFDRTGQEVNLNTEGNYYDIDYDKLSDYIQVPDDKKNYILQNPVGKVFYMDNLNETGIARVNYSSAKEEDDNPIEEGLMNPIESREPIGEEIAIDSADKLAKIGQPGEPKYPLSGKYILTANIDLSEYSKGEGWIPIGTSSSRFTGSFDGNGYKVTGLIINRSTESDVGLFGYTDRATIENVALEDINVTGTDFVGGLVGYANNSTMIRNSYATGSVEGAGSRVGGLMGYAGGRSIIENSYSTGSVTGSVNYVGGLVGQVDKSTINNSYATGAVTGHESIGGLVGYASGTTIENSYARGSVTGSEKVGGLVGNAHSENTIRNSYATGSVTSSGDFVGGLVGDAYSGPIENSYATGSVTGDSRVGGLVGRANSRAEINNSYATGEVTGKDYVGGFVGSAYESTINNSYTTGSVTGTNQVGGLVGGASGSTIENSYWNTKTTGQPTSAVGGEGKTTDEMKKKETYLGWDFVDVWKINDGDYPKLR